jgi:hypothetical protein
MKKAFLLCEYKKQTYYFVDFFQEAKKNHSTSFHSIINGMYGFSHKKKSISRDMI